MSLMKTPWGKQESGYWDLFYRKTKAHRGAGLSQKDPALSLGLLTLHPKLFLCPTPLSPDFSKPT